MLVKPDGILLENMNKVNFAYKVSTKSSMTKHISTPFRFKDGTFVLWVAPALRRPLTGLLNGLTGDIWQANLSGHLRDTAREKNIPSDLGDSHANTF